MAFVIEDLPTEVIVIIFQHLSIKDLQNCSQTCRKWEKIVVQFFFKPQLRSISKFDDFTKKKVGMKNVTILDLFYLCIEFTILGQFRIHKYRDKDGYLNFKYI